MKESAKGDVGVAQVTSDLITKGYEILLPVSASSPYDMVICKNNKFYKVQVKYRENHKGYIKLEQRRLVKGGKTQKHRRMREDEVDLYAIYCPDTKEVYYINPLSVKNQMAITLRLDISPSYRATKAARYAKDYLTLAFLTSD